VRFFKALVLAALIIVFLCSVVSADFTAKTKTTTSGIMGMGGMTSETAYFIKGDEVAIAYKMEMSSMGQGPKGGNSTKMIFRKGGKELVIINNNEGTYSILDEKMIDSMASLIGNLGGMADSLMEMMTVETMEAKITDSTREIQNLKAREMSLNMHVIMNIQMMGPETTPVNMKMNGSMWGTKDFDEYETYAGMIEDVSSLLMSGSGGGFSGLMTFMKAFGIDPETMDEAMKFATYIPLEGMFNINMEIPNMPMNMTMNTELVETSKENIPDSEFKIPEDMEQVEPDLDFSGGGMGFPGMGQ
jgi:hypothetical protein